jgi:hypothetical protein
MDLGFWGWSSPLLLREAGDDSYRDLTESSVGVFVFSFRSQYQASGILR